MTQKLPYHRENLRQTLLDSALELIAQVGPQAFTLREVARRANVSHNAPYRHFNHKDHLLAAVAEDGFERLTASMVASAAKGSSAVERLQLCGVGYVDFALSWPNHFKALFDPPPAVITHCDLKPPERDAFGVLIRHIVEVQKSGAIPKGNPLPHALTAWSLVHGIAKLATSGQILMPRAKLLAFARQATETLTAGFEKQTAKHR